MSDRLKRRIPDRQTRLELLETIWYESKRRFGASNGDGLDASRIGFQKYATRLLEREVICR